MSFSTTSIFHNPLVMDDKKKWLMRVGRESESKLYEGALMVSNISPAQPMEMDTFERLRAGVVKYSEG